MIEVILRQFLTERLKIPVFLEKPKVSKDQYLVIEKTGGAENNKLASSVFAIQSYAPSLYEAATLNLKVKEAMAELPSLDDIGGVELNTDYNWTDPETKEYRYQAVYDITHY